VWLYLSIAWRLASFPAEGGTELNDEHHSRRDFLSRFGWLISLATFGGFTGASIRYLWPNVLYEPPKSFKLDKPYDYPEGVDFVADKRIFIVRHGSLIKVVSAVCTHIGCTVRWVGERDRWECPCHGSIFNSKGVRIAGPARRPLPWYDVSLTADGRLFVNERRIVPFAHELSLKT
jgi:cytochrome b6-f complex iron-sulfur subunit